VLEGMTMDSSMTGRGNESQVYVWETGGTLGADMSIPEIQELCDVGSCMPAYLWTEIVNDYNYFKLLCFIDTLRLCEKYTYGTRSII